MLSVAIFVYALFTGLCFLSQSDVQFAAFRGLTGFGIGGVFGLAVALIAETVHTRARTAALGLLQVLSTVGNITAVFVFYGVKTLASTHVLPSQENGHWWGQPWRWTFLVSAIPAMAVVIALQWVREPEKWLHLKREGLLPRGSILGPYIALLKDDRWRRNLICGGLIAATGVVGLWAIAEYLVDLQKAVFDAYFQVRHASSDEIDRAKSLAYVLYMLGGTAGMWLFTRMAILIGRKPSFYIGFSLAMVVTFLVYWKKKTPTDAYWMSPLMGAAQLSVFAGFAIYLPELFPSLLRSTGTSFCYNVGRFAAAGGSFVSAYLSKGVFAHFSKADPSLPARYSAMTMCALFLVGLLTLPFAPETKGRPLPE